MSQVANILRRNVALCSLVGVDLHDGGSTHL
jgi:hypothetical protein